MEFNVHEKAVKDRKMKEGIRKEVKLFWYLTLILAIK
jgi:hypothetical protein